MKMIQLNIWHGKLGDAAIRFINEQRPDFVFLQETSEIQGPTAGMFVPLHEVQAQTGLAHSFFAPTVTYAYMRRQCHYGNAILSRLPLQHEQTVFITGHYKENFDRAMDEYNLRNLQICQIELPTRVITLVNHHGYRIQNQHGDENSLEALKKVAKILDDIDEPLIFCGDLNVSPDSPAFAPLKNLPLRNLSVENGLSSTLSQVHRLSAPIVCDYIFVSRDIPVTTFAASDEIVSDHKPLVMEFDEF